MALTDKLTAVANAIRAKTGGTATMTLAEMPTKIAGIKTKSTYTWNQCPTAVKNYLDNVTYNPNDYTTSQIANYAPAVAVRANTKPIGKTVDGVTYYNEIPNVATPFSSANEAGTLKPLDRLRWINSQTPNMRDLGGWNCDGGTVKYGKLFRGGEPLAGDKALALSLGIRHELNLRGNEVPLRTTSVWDIEYSQFDDVAWHLSTAAVWSDILRTIFNCVNHNIPLFFHCAEGADRTGACALIIEAILGVSQSDMDKEYELTSFNSGTDTDAHARRRDEAAWTYDINFINALEGNTFRDKAINFAIARGITYDEINEFRANLIDGTPDPINPPSIHNLVDDIGYTADARIGTSDGANRTGAAGYAVFGADRNVASLIDIAPNDTIRIKGVSFPTTSDNKSAVCVYTSTGAFKNATYVYSTKADYALGLHMEFGDTITTITNTTNNTIHFRIGGGCASPSTVFITRNGVIE